MLNSLEGKCVFTQEQIKRRMESMCERVNSLSEQVRQLQDQSSEAEAIVSEITERRQKLLSWAEMFDSTSLQEKKKVASYLIKATLTRGYGIQVEFNISEAQYLGGMEMGLLSIWKMRYGIYQLPLKH